MATISTSQTFDSAARTAGEAFTIQSGAVFTIDSDTRDGKNAAASRAGSMSSFTMTAASGGQVVVDGTKVWLIAYDGRIGTPNVPALGTIIAGVTSGAYGDPTHQWPPVCSWTYFYLDRAWREVNAPHAGYTCDFAYVLVGTHDPNDAWVAFRNVETKSVLMSRNINTVTDLIATVTKRKAE